MRFAEDATYQWNDLLRYINTCTDELLLLLPTRIARDDNGVFASAQANSVVGIDIDLPKIWVSAFAG